MNFQGAIIKEQGVTFAVVIVKKHVIDSTFTANECICNFQPFFPSLPVVLMAQDYHGRATYYGRKDIVKFLSNIPLYAIPWKKISIN